MRLYRATYRDKKTGQKRTSKTGRVEFFIKGWRYDKSPGIKGSKSANATEAAALLGDGREEGIVKPARWLITQWPCSGLS